jgi:hypothetical protein
MCRDSDSTACPRCAATADSCRCCGWRRRHRAAIEQAIVGAAVANDLKVGRQPALAHHRRCTPARQHNATRGLRVFTGRAHALGSDGVRTTHCQSALLTASPPVLTGLQKWQVLRHGFACFQWHGPAWLRMVPHDSARPSRRPTCVAADLEPLARLEGVVVVKHVRMTVPWDGALQDHDKCCSHGTSISANKCCTTAHHLQLTYALTTAHQLKLTNALATAHQPQHN